MTQNQVIKEESECNLFVVEAHLRLKSTALSTTIHTQDISQKVFARKRHRPISLFILNLVNRTVLDVFKSLIVLLKVAYILSESFLVY